jgi:hypothetical protein
MPKESAPVTRPSTSLHEQRVDHYFRALNALAKNAASPRRLPAAPKVDIKDEIAREQKIKNDDAEQNIRLKRATLNRLFIFLTVETALIFIFTYFQAVGWPFDFHLEEWSFRLVVTATIVQINGMLFVAVRYLFPKSGA